MISALDDLSTALDLSPGETQLLADTLRDQYERGLTAGVRKAWDESKHPRDHGKFSEKPGGGKGEPKTDRRGFLVQEGEPFELRTWSNIPRDEMVTLRPQLKRGKWSWGAHETKPVKSWDDTELAEHLGEPAVAGTDKAKRSAILARTSLHDNKGRELTPGELWAAGLPGGHSPPAPEQDWRPDETVPEDYYAAGGGAAAHQTGEEWRESLTAEERKEVARFQGGGFAMQKDLRSGDPDATTLTRAALMDSAIAKSPGLRADLTLYRGLDFDTPQQAQQFLAGKQVGDEFTDLGYGSTSVDEAYIKTFWRGNEGPRSVRVDVRAPEGTAGAYMSEGGAAHLDHEREFLLARGARFRVDEVKPLGNGGTHLILSLLGTGQKKAFDPSQERDAHGRWTGPDSPHKPTHALTAEQRDLLRQLSLHFPDGIHHLLDDSGRVDSSHTSESEQITPEQQQQADQLRQTWGALNDAIEAKLSEADDIEMYDLADDALTSLINATLYNGDFAAISSGDAVREQDFEIADALDGIGEELRDLDSVAYPQHPRLPSEEDYRGNIDNALREPSEYDDFADLLSSYEEEVLDRRSVLTAIGIALDGAKEKATAVSQEYRDALDRRLHWVAGQCTAALDIPADDWDAVDGGVTLRAQVQDLAQRVAALREHFGERKAIRKAAAHAPKGGVTIGGKKFAGGEFIPAHVMAEATEEEKEQVESSEEESEEEWDGEIDQDAVNSANTPYSDRNIAQWSNEDGEKHEIWVEEGRFTPPGEDEITVYRFISFDSNDDREQEGEWVAERDDAIREGKQYARNNHEESRDPEDSDIGEVSGQDWGNRETIGNYTTADGDDRTVRLEEGTFEFGGAEHECYRWTTRRDEDGEWTMDRRQAVRDGEAYAEDNHHEQEEDDSPDYSDVDGGEMPDFSEIPPPTKREVTLGEEKQAKSTAKFEMGNVDADRANHLIRTIFGDESDEAGHASLIASLGMPDDATVRVTYAGDYQKLFSDDMPADGAQGVRVSVDHPKMGRVFRFAGVDHDGKRFIRNEIIEIKAAHQGEGLGAEIFSKQVEAAAESGIDYIGTHAAGSPGGSMNGYYTWPRFGYNQDIDDSTALGRRVLAKFPDAESILDVMATQEGRDWWKENGSDLYKARFDLTPGSRSMAILSAYQQERAKKKGTRKSIFRPTTKPPLMRLGSNSTSKTKSS